MPNRDTDEEDEQHGRNRTVEYDKLVRDRIPEIIEENDQNAVTHRADEEEYLELLAQKLVEEAEEYCENREIKEVADVLEVVYAICEFEGIGRVEIENLREQKAENKGSFEKRVVLEKVVE